MRLMSAPLALTILMLGCKPAAPNAPVPDATGGSATITVVAMNDFHGALYETPDPDDPSRAMGGLPVLVGALDLLRSEDPHLLLLDGGDQFQGSWPVNASKGRGAIEALALVGLDAAAVGNHEFDYGPLDGGHPLRGALEDGAKRAPYAFLAANIHEPDGSRWQPEGVQPWTVIERKGVKIGVIGLSTQDTPQTTLLRHVEDLTFADPVEVVREAVPELKALGAQVVVGVGHLTGSCDAKSWTVPPAPCLPDGEIGRLLTELPPGTLDVLVVGHAHTLMAHRWDDTFILENRTKGHMLGRIDLVVGPDGVDADASVIHPPWVLEHAAIDPGCDGGDYPLDPLDVGGRTVTPSAEAVALIARLEEEAGSLCDEVGCAAVALGRNRQAESAVGIVVADAMLAAFPDADLAVTNSGGLRDDIPAGPVRREHLQAVMPFENTLRVVEMTGSQVRTMMRLGSSGAHGILQIAGGAYHFDPAATSGDDLNGDGEIEAWETNRLCDVTVGGAALDDARTYRVVTTDFLYDGGDHMGPAFAGTTVAEEGGLLRDVLFTYVDGLQTCLGEDRPLPDPDAPRIVRASCP